MPTYDYACTACGHRFEQFHGMTAAPLRTCPACGADRLERLIGAGAGVIFKGSGFYQTDYKNPGSSGGTNAGGGSGKDRDGGEKTGSDGPGAAGGGCTPTCGTDAAPPGCRRAPQDRRKD